MAVSLDRLNPFAFSELGHVRSFTGGTVQLALGGPGLTGVLEPGDYRFSFASTLAVSATHNGQPTPGAFGSGNGQFELTLNHKKNGNGNHVPDAGSTMTLLGMALGGLGFFVRQRI